MLDETVYDAGRGRWRDGRYGALRPRYGRLRSVPVTRQIEPNTACAV